MYLSRTIYIIIYSCVQLINLYMCRKRPGELMVVANAGARRGSVGDDLDGLPTLGGGDLRLLAGQYQRRRRRRQQILRDRR